jgi:RNA polymerase sigma factor (sigma-70 family)
MQSVPSPTPHGPALMAIMPRTPARSPAAEEPGRLRVLMAAAQDGDANAYQALLRECVPMIRRMARQNGIAPDAVDDVVQDTLMTVHRARHTFDRARPLLPWLRAIVQRRGIDVQRRTGRQASRELHVPLAYEAHPDPAAGADQHVVDLGRAARLGAAVAQLPPGQRQALEELGLQEHTLAEAAIRTGRSVGALKVNLHRALKSLRVILGGEDR